MSSVGQRSGIVLTFTAMNNTNHVQMESIKIMNRTHGGDTVLVWPDTVLMTNLWVGVPEDPYMNGFKLYQNSPNPAGDQTTIHLTVPEQDHVNLLVTDVRGRTVLSIDRILSGGMHNLLFIPGKEAVYILSATWKGLRKSIKIFHTDIGMNQPCALEFTGQTIQSHTLKMQSDARNFVISPGDELLYIGNAESLESGIIDKPAESKTVTFQFAAGIPCPGIPTVNYGGKVYNTIQIFGQCWIKENLNVGTMITGDQEMADNGTIEKYCYENLPDYCDLYFGGLYRWGEMMQYQTWPGAQGICPTGWHIPTNEEWKVLEGAADSENSIGSETWDWTSLRGFNAGLNLKYSGSWEGDAGNDLYGFSAMGGGLSWPGGFFSDVGYNGFWWTSSDYDAGNAWFHQFVNYHPGAVMNTEAREKGFSIRCLKDM
jgi:uncharacterized protein (TIGR02145 family)